MKTSLRYSAAFVLSVCFAGSALAAEIDCASSELSDGFNGANARPLVVPGVETWRGGDGKTQLSAASRIRVDNLNNAELRQLAQNFQGQLQRVTGLNLPVVDNSASGASANDIVLSLTTCSGAPAAAAEEGYTLAIGAPVTLRASSGRGLFYATQTLLQLATLQQDHTSLPRGYIADKPRYAERSIMFDVGRKFASVDFLTNYIKFLGWYKINTLHLHLNDQDYDANRQWGLRAFRLKTDNPEFAGLIPSDNLYYTRADWDKLETVAAQYGVRIVPEIDTPGHAGAFVLARPDIAYSGDNPPGGIIDPRKPETLTYIKSVFDEFLPWFRSPVVHIGADEVNMNNGTIPASAQVAYVNALGGYLQSKGKTVQLWGDKSYLPTLNKQFWVQRWINYGGEASFNWTQQGYRWTESSGDWYITPGDASPAFHPNGITGLQVYNKWPASTATSAPVGGQISVWNDHALTFKYTYEQDVNRYLKEAIPAAGQIFWGGKAVDAQGQTLAYSQLRPSVSKLQYGPDVSAFASAPIAGN